MTSCSTDAPNIVDATPSANDLIAMDMFDFWRDLQVWAISANQIILNGTQEPPEQPEPTRYIKVSDIPEMHALVETTKSFDGEWYQFTYLASEPFGKPSDNGEVFYNQLDATSVDKFQIEYNWNESFFERDSLFLGNIQYPLDVGDISYRYNSDKTISKLEKKYLFQLNSFVAFFEVVETFTPPIDDGAELCQDKKTVVRKYTFDKALETFSYIDHVYGHIVGKCGYDGYSFTGTSTGADWSLVGNGDAFELSNDTLTNLLIADGILTSSYASQKLVCKMTQEGSFSVESNFNLGYGRILKLVAVNNTVVFDNGSYSFGTLSVDRNGILSDFTNDSQPYDEYLDGSQYEFTKIALVSSSGELALEVSNSGGLHTSGTLVCSI